MHMTFDWSMILSFSLFGLGVLGLLYDRFRLPVLRQVGKLPQPLISRQQAIEKAKDEWEKRGCAWNSDSIQVREQTTCYCVYSFYCIGRPTYARIDAFTGEILEASASVGAQTEIES